MSMPKVVLLWSDYVVLLLVLSLVVYGLRVRGSATQRATWARVFRDAPALCASVVLLAFLAVALLDSLHFRRALPPSAGVPQAQAYATQTESALDVLLARQIAGRESTYSAPLAARLVTVSISRVDVTRCVSSPEGGDSVVGPRTSTTLAPRRASSRAISIPIRPVEAFDRNRTSSIASRVGPAVTTTRGVRRLVRTTT